jgi:Cys-tRNA(Pro)/Cys-tRNA(Cys) deacylase
MEKTNVMRLLDAAEVSYAPHEYDPSMVDGQTVANILHQNPAAVFKTLVCVSSSKQYFVFDVPVAAELNFKKAAKAAHAKSIELIPLKDLLPLTGYLHGGCSPIGLKRPFQVYIDESAQSLGKIFVSAGKRGFQVELSPKDLAAFVNAEFASLI